MVTEAQRREKERRKREQRERIVAKKQASLEKEREAKIPRGGGLTDQDRLELARSRAKAAGLLDLPARIEPQTGQIQTEREVAEARAAEVTQPTFVPGQQEVLEAGGAFEDVTPEERALTPPLKTDIPIISPSLAALSQIAGERGLLGIARDRGWLGDLLPPVITAEEAFPTPENPETLREAALREIRKEAFKEDTSVAEGFGTLIESIPVVGNRASAWADGLIEAPYENAILVIDEINKIKEAASTGQEKVRNGLEDPEYGLSRARGMEEDLAKLTGRLKLLVITSARLQASVDEVNKIQEQVLEAEEKVSRYRTASEFGWTAQLTGTGRIIPTDEILFYELKKTKE